MTVTATPGGPAPVDFAAIYRREQSGVVRIETLSCDASGIGTGFLLTPTLVATVDHVVDRSVVVSLIAGGQRTTGTVIGTDRAHDLALVRANAPLRGHHFTFAEHTPAVGDDVGAIGFPIGDPITLTRGGVSGLDRRIVIGGRPYTGLIETDAAINPGNSGGPLVGAAGTVIGLVDAKDTHAEGIAYAVPAQEAAADVRQWRGDPRPVPPASCPDPLGPSQADTHVHPPGDLSSEQAQGIAAAFNTYFGGINSGNYAAAYAVLSPRLRANSTEAEFAAGDATSYDFDIAVLAARSLSASSARVALSFTSLQTAAKGPDGDTCDLWTLDYTMIRATDGSWQIDGADPYNGVMHTRC